MKKGGKAKRFLGHALHRGTLKNVVSLIEMTTGRFKVHKRFFKTEETFWRAIEILTGMRPHDGEGFVNAVLRIQSVIGSHSLEWRNEMLSKVNAEAFYDAIGVRVTETVTFEQIQKNAAKYGQRVSSPARPTVQAKDEFYASWEWRTLRMEVLKEQGTTCNCCGASKGDTDMSGKPVKIVVDHIKPLSKHWNLRLEKSNLQVLCDECNMGKGNWDETDFRQPPAPDEWVLSDCGIDPKIVHQLTDQTTGTLQ